jgi:hypothetical protein
VQGQAATADHDDIRDALADARLDAVGSALWRRPVTATLWASSGHFARQERGALAAFGRHATPALRHELGHQLAAFIAALTPDATPEHAHPLRPRRASPARRDGSARHLLQEPPAGPGPRRAIRAAMAPVTPMPANAVKNATKDTAVAGTSAPPPRPRPSERENSLGRARVGKNSAVQMQATWR